MQKVTITYDGFIELDYNDLKITEINETTGDYVPVDVSKITPEEAMDGIRDGKYFVDICQNMPVALDGNETIEAELDTEELDDF
jgi:hypothetical protein